MDERKRFGLLVAWLIVALLPLAACGAPQLTSTPVSPTPTALLPTETALPATETPPEPVTTEPTSTRVVRRAFYWGIPYSESGHLDQKLSVYLPADAVEEPEKTYPVLFLAHGYTMGKDASPLWDVIQHENSRGIAAVTMDYRDDHQDGGAWPAHHDAACALAWVFANGNDYGLDVDRMVGFGNSYGAILLANLAMADDPGFFLDECPNTLPQTRPLLGVVAFGAPGFGLSGPGMTFATEDEAEIFEQLGLFEGTKDEILALMEAISDVEPLEWATHDGFSQEEARMAQVWPVYWADSGDPPILILTGDHDLEDWTLQDRVGFVELLHGLGVEATHVLLPFTGHTTFNRDAATWQEPLDEFLDRVLGRPVSGE